MSNTPDLIGLEASMSTAGQYQETVFLGTASTSSKISRCEFLRPKRGEGTKENGSDRIVEMRARSCFERRLLLDAMASIATCVDCGLVFDILSCSPLVAKDMTARKDVRHPLLRGRTQNVYQFFKFFLLFVEKRCY